MEVLIVVQLPPEDSGIQNSIVRFHNSRMDSKKADKSRFFRREPLMIINPETGARVLRVAMGNPGLEGIVKNGVGLDYDAVDALGVRFNRDVKLEVRRATILDVYQWYWQHPDVGLRLSSRLGIVGGILGVLGFVVGVIPLVVQLVS
ncbi:TPA: hypothetical protein VDU83_002658 [Pseudomonas aeruginosa]|nr:hypothetical protein [Pseudomonas aeruginosa]